MFEAVSGARMMHNYFRIGGLKEDLPENFEQMVRDLLPLIREDVEESDRLLTFNEYSWLGLRMSASSLPRTP